jgi:hypothetical protein
MEWLKENWIILIPLITFIIGWLFPNPKITEFGQKIGKDIPQPIRELIAEKLDALEQGLLNADVDGNKEIVDNNTVKEIVKGTKIDLGLTE